MSRSPASPALPRCLRTAVAEHGMLRPGDRVVVALSGGADSVALLHALRALQAEPGCPFTLAAAHLNHNLRGEESARDEAFVRRLCAGWGIPLTVRSLPIASLAAGRSQSVELCAREERYAFFRSLEGRIATAHTLDDSAETVVLNLVRGSGLRGLCGIPPVRERIIRPLIRCTRADVEAYCAAHGLAYVVDSTNLTDDYTRNRLRHAVTPVLREINPAFPGGLAEMTRSLRADEDYLCALGKQALRETALADGVWDAPALAGYPEPVRRRAIRRMLTDRGIPVDRLRISRMERLLLAAGEEPLSARWRCTCRRGRLTVEESAGEEPPLRTVELRAPFTSARIPVGDGKTLLLRVVERTNFELSINILPKQFKNALDCDKIGKIVTIRPRMPGDRIRLAGRGCTKTLKKLMNESGLPPAQRARTLVLTDETGPLWVEGFGVAECAGADPGSQRLLVVEVEERAGRTGYFFREGGND